MRGPGVALHMQTWLYHSKIASGNPVLYMYYSNQDDFSPRFISDLNVSPELEVSRADKRVKFAHELIFLYSAKKANR